MASDESFVTPVSSTDDLMTLSPNRIGLDGSENSDTKCDYLTDADIDNSICDVTMREVPAHDDNIFIDPNTLDFFEKGIDSNKNQAFIDRGKDSLFAKFDPLYANTLLTNCSREKSQGDLSLNDVGYETSSSNSILMDNIGMNSKNASSAESVVSKSGIEKPTQMVSPVVSTTVPKISAKQTATPALVRSISAILTPTQVGPERLINISGITPPMAAPRTPRSNYYAPEVDHLQSWRAILQNQDQELRQLQHEKKQLEYEVQRTKEELGSQIKKLTSDIDTMRYKETQLVQQINDKKLNNKQMAIVMEEYEKTLSFIIDKQETLESERDQALNHLSINECAFNDLLNKYEKAKVVIYELKNNQKMLVDKKSEYEEGLAKYEGLYNDLKRITSDSLNKANETLEQNNKAHHVEIAKLNATIKKHEITICSLQESLTQKEREVEELTQICDQLINDVP